MSYPGDSERQGSLAYYSSWGLKESDTAEQLNNCYDGWCCPCVCSGKVCFLCSLRNKEIIEGRSP